MHVMLTPKWRALTARLENVPAFWAVYALILVETIGEGVLAIPIAVAKIGPLAGVVVLILIGAVNTITIVSIAEASARNGSIRYGGAYLGRVVQDYLGNTGTFVLVLAVTVIQLLALISYYVGFSTTMAAATHIPATAWAVAIFLVCFYFLKKGSFASTTAFALLIGGVNLVIVLSLCLLTIPHIQLENILHTGLSLSSSKAFDPSLLELVFGVVFSAYLGHLGVANSAQLALRRDTSARSLIWGSVAAQTSLILIYSLWVIVVNGAVSPSILASESGTALVPLASQIGPMSYVLGSFLIFLGIGGGSIVTALGLFCLVREWLPTSFPTPIDPRHSKGQPLQKTIGAALCGKHGHFWLSATPVLGVFGYVEWLLLSGQESFCAPLSFLGVLAAPLIAGVFPLLLMVASRAKGDIPMRRCLGWLENPLVIAGIYAVFLINLLVHGLFIWQHPVERFAALVIGAGVLAVPVVLIRQGAFASRTVIELRRELLPESGGFFAIVTSGRAAEATVRIEYADYGPLCLSSTGTIPDFSSLRRLQINLPGPAQELKIWVHRVTADGNSEGIPVRLTLASAGQIARLELRSPAGKTVFPIAPGPIDLEMELLSC